MEEANPAAAPPPGRRRVRLDISPLRESRQFRLLFASGLVTFLGSQMTFVALPFQVAELTGSYLAVGLLGLVELLPLVVFGLYGGVLADRLDRRRIVLLAEIASLLLSAVLMVNALLPSPLLPVLYVVSLLFAAVDGLQRPSLEALVPRVVRHEQLAAAGALSTMKWNLGAIVGPAMAGLILASGGAAWAYGADVVSFVVSALLLWRMQAVPAVGGDDADDPPLRAVLVGLRYAWTRRDLLGSYLVDIAAMLFAFPYALFPFVAEQFDAPWSLGFLYAAGSVGGLAVTLTSGWTSHVRRVGRGVVLAAIGWGAAIGAIGLAPGIWWVLGFLVLAGAADMISGQLRLLLWNQSIPAELRGRMAGVELLSYSVGPMLGQVRSSVAAAATSLRMSFLSGGVMCIVAVGIVAVAMPTLWRYDARTDPHAAAARRQSAGGQSSSPAS